MRKYHDLLHYWANHAILQLSTQSNRNERVHYRLMWRDLAEKGFVTVTSYTSGRYVELKITRANGQLVIIDGFTARED